VVQVTLSHAVPTTDILYVFFDLATGTVASDGDQVSAQLDNVVVNTVTESDTVSIGTNTISNVLTINTDTLTVDSVAGSAPGTVPNNSSNVQMLELTLDSDLAGDQAVKILNIEVDVSASGGIGRVTAVHVSDTSNNSVPLGTNNTPAATTTVSLGAGFDITSGNDPATLYVFYDLAGVGDGETVTAQLNATTGIDLDTGTESDTWTIGTFNNPNTVNITQPFDTLTFSDTPKGGSVVKGNAVATHELLVTSDGGQDSQASWTGLTVTLSDVNEATNIANIYVNDTNDTNTPLGTITQPTISNGTNAITLSETITTPTTYWVLVETNAGANTDDTFTTTIAAVGDVVISAPDLVQNVNFPINSNTFTITAATTDHLTVDSAPGAGAATSPVANGTADLEMLQLDLADDVPEGVDSQVTVERIDVTVNATGNTNKVSSVCISTISGSCDDLASGGAGHPLPRRSHHRHPLRLLRPGHGHRCQRRRPGVGAA
jgi:hypothetical protein